MPEIDCFMFTRDTIKRQFDLVWHDGLNVQLANYIQKCFFPLITENHRKSFLWKIKMLYNCDKVDDVTTPYKYDSFECYRLYNVVYYMLEFMYMLNMYFFLNGMLEVSLTYVWITSAPFFIIMHQHCIILCNWRRWFRFSCTYTKKRKEKVADEYFIV